ncbi:MAG: FecR domain-containing protein, partial [Bacteroidales bacterium]
FDVTPDPGRPFLLVAGDTRVEVSGTQFSVNAPKKTGEVEVSVHSGQVLFYNSHIVSKNAFRMGLGPGDMGIYSPTLRRMDKTRDPLYYSAP